ncbi:MAG: hypothetical protein ACYDDF_08455 [Thermoplasmatota archaeon]
MMKRVRLLAGAVAIANILALAGCVSVSPVGAGPALPVSSTETFLRNATTCLRVALTAYRSVVIPGAGTGIVVNATNCGTGPVQAFNAVCDQAQFFLTFNDSGDIALVGWGNEATSQHPTWSCTAYERPTPTLAPRANISSPIAWDGLQAGDCPSARLAPPPGFATLSYSPPFAVGTPGYPAHPAVVINITVGGARAGVVRTCPSR